MPILLKLAYYFTSGSSYSSHTNKPYFIVETGSVMLPHT